MAVTVLVAAPGALVWAVAPATAQFSSAQFSFAQSWWALSASGACVGDSGVTVVVDFQQLGGGAQTGCDPAGGGRVAAATFSAAGFPLTYVQQTPGFTCRVSGKPASDPCVRTPPATAYWSLWWSDGKSGTWSYATVGAGSLKVPSGGYVAFSWQGQSGRALPGVSPAPRRSPEPAPAPTSSPTPDKAPDNAPDKPPKSEPSGGQDKSEGQPEAAPSPTASTREPKQAERTPMLKPSDASGDHEPAAPTADPSPEAAASEPAASGDEPGRLPGWFSLALILGLAGAAAAAWWWRRPASGGP